MEKCVWSNWTGDGFGGNAMRMQGFDKYRTGGRDVFIAYSMGSFVESQGYPASANSAAYENRDVDSLTTQLYKYDPAQTTQVPRSLGTRGFRYHRWHRQPVNGLGVQGANFSSIRAN